MSLGRTIADSFAQTMFDLAKLEQRDALDHCAVSKHCMGGLPITWFLVDAITLGKAFHFCPRHSLAAQALTAAGFDATTVVHWLKTLEEAADAPPLTVTIRVAP